MGPEEIFPRQLVHASRALALEGQETTYPLVLEFSAVQESSEQ